MMTTDRLKMTMTTTNTMIMMFLNTCFLIAGTELVGTSKRAFAGIAIRIFYSIGMMLLAVIAWLLREWSHIELAISVPPIIFLIYYW